MSTREPLRRLDHPPTNADNDRDNGLTHTHPTGAAQQFVATHHGLVKSASVSKIVITPTGLSRRDRDALRVFTCKLGAVYCGDLVRGKTTHLVCRRILDTFGSLKYHMATSWGVTVVNLKWIIDGALAGNILPTENYKTDPEELPQNDPGMNTSADDECKHEVFFHAGHADPLLKALRQVWGSDCVPEDMAEDNVNHHLVTATSLPAETGWAASQLASYSHTMSGAPIARTFHVPVNSTGRHIDHDVTIPETQPDHDGCANGLLTPNSLVQYVRQQVCTTWDDVKQPALPDSPAAFGRSSYQTASSSLEMLEHEAGERCSSMLRGGGNHVIAANDRWPAIGFVDVAMQSATPQSQCRTGYQLAIACAKSSSQVAATPVQLQLLLSPELHACPGNTDAQFPLLADRRSLLSPPNALPHTPGSLLRLKGSLSTSGRCGPGQSLSHHPAALAPTHKHVQQTADGFMTLRLGEMCSPARSSSPRAPCQHASEHLAGAVMEDCNPAANTRSQCVTPLCTIGSGRRSISDSNMECSQQWMPHGLQAPPTIKLEPATPAWPPGVDAAMCVGSQLPNSCSVCCHQPSYVKLEPEAEPQPCGPYACPNPSPEAEEAQSVALSLQTGGAMQWQGEGMGSSTRSRCNRAAGRRPLPFGHAPLAGQSVTAARPLATSALWSNGSFASAVHPSLSSTTCSSMPPTSPAPIDDTSLRCALGPEESLEAFLSASLTTAAPLDERRDVVALKRLARQPRGSTVREFHRLGSCRDVQFAESVQLSWASMELTTRNKASCAVVEQRSGRDCNSSGPHELQGLVGEPCCFYCLPEGNWWMEYVELLPYSYARAVGAQLPADFLASYELLHGTQRMHCPLQHVIGGVQVRKAKRAPPVHGPPIKCFFWRFVLDQDSKRVLTDRPAADFLLV